MALLEGLHSYNIWEDEQNSIDIEVESLGPNDDSIFRLLVEPNIKLTYFNAPIQESTGTKNYYLTYVNTESLHVNLIFQIWPEVDPNYGIVQASDNESDCILANADPFSVQRTTNCIASLANVIDVSSYIKY